MKSLSYKSLQILLQSVKDTLSNKLNHNISVVEKVERIVFNIIVHVFNDILTL